MIDNLDDYYAQIANSMTEAIPEEWTEALFEATFYEDCITFEAEYIRKSDKRARGFRPESNGEDAFIEIRNLFKEAGKPLWGKAIFHLVPKGKFKMVWDYDNCDKDGNSHYDQEKEIKRVKERHKRLSSA